MPILELEPAMPAIIGGGAAVMAAVITLFGVLYGHLYRQIDELRDELRAADAHNREMWAYCRRLLDLYYRHRRDGAPDPDPLPEPKEP